MRIYWLIIILTAVGFFYFFWKLEPVKPAWSKVRLSNEISPNYINIDDGESSVITIKLKAENPTDEAYDSNEYFYRIVLNRSYPDSPGFVIKEFSKTLEPKGSFDTTVVWQEDYLPNDELEFRIHFNLYKRSKGGDPIILAASTKILHLRR